MTIDSVVLQDLLDLLHDGPARLHVERRLRLVERLVELRIGSSRVSFQATPVR